MTTTVKIDATSLGAATPTMNPELIIQVPPGTPAREMSYQEAIREALREEMVNDERVFLMGEDIGLHGGAFGVTRTLYDQFGPERVRNTPISENTIVGAATGAAIAHAQATRHIALGRVSTSVENTPNQGATSAHAVSAPSDVTNSRQVASRVEWVTKPATVSATRRAASPTTAHRSTERSAKVIMARG